MSEEIKINKLSGSITFANNGIAFSQFGIAKEILDLIEDLQQKVEQLENIRKETIEYLEYQLSQMDFEKDTKAKMLGAMTIVLLNKGSKE